MSELHTYHAEGQLYRSGFAVVAIYAPRRKGMLQRSGLGVRIPHRLACWLLAHTPVVYTRSAERPPVAHR